MDNELTIQNQALDHIRELLSAHWREAKDSADDDGKFCVGLRITVTANHDPAQIDAFANDLLDLLATTRQS